jgi:hypothetical protein
MEPVWLVWAREQTVVTQSDADFGRVEELFAEQSGYATPKVDVRGAVFDDDARILLVREIADNGRWTIRAGGRT